MPGIVLTEDDLIWGIRRNADQIQVTVGSGDRAFKVLSNEYAAQLAESLADPDYKYELLGYQLNHTQRQQLAATIHKLLDEQ